MVRASYEQKPYRKVMMQSYGARVHASPSKETQIGRKMSEDKRNYPGSLGIAISEAVEIAATSGGTVKYSLGSVLNHVLMHQTVIGLEAQAVLEDLGLYPDIVIACHGGGSNFGGIAIPFMEDKISGKRKTEFIASEPLACPSLSKGIYAYDFGDAGKLIPLAKMYTLGHGFIPPVRARRRAALPRRRAHRVASQQQGADPRRGAAAEGDLRGRGALCPHGRHHPGARVGARHRLGHPGGEEVQGDR